MEEEEEEEEEEPKSGTTFGLLVRPLNPFLYYPWNMLLPFSNGFNFKLTVKKNQGMSVSNIFLIEILLVTHFFEPIS